MAGNPKWRPWLLNVSGVQFKSAGLNFTFAMGILLKMYQLTFCLSQNWVRNEGDTFNVADRVAEMSKLINTMMDCKLLLNTTFSFLLVWVSPFTFSIWTHPVTIFLLFYLSPEKDYDIKEIVFKWKLKNHGGQWRIHTPSCISQSMDYCEINIK